MDTQKGFIRKTKQRDLILKVLRSTDTHPTADWIYEQVKKEMPNISLGTVYRNLGKLAELGEITELKFGSKYSRFDGNPDNHYHFVCTECEKVIDVKGCPVDEEIDRCIELNNDVKVFFTKSCFMAFAQIAKTTSRNKFKGWRSSKTKIAFFYFIFAFYI